MRIAAWVATKVTHGCASTTRVGGQSLNDAILVGAFRVQLELELLLYVL